MVQKKLGNDKRIRSVRSWNIVGGEIKVINLKDAVLGAFFLAVLFPYISPIPVVSSDTQPWAVLLGVITITLSIGSEIRLGIPEITLVVSSIVAFSEVIIKGVLLGSHPSEYLRASYKFLSIVVTLIATLITMKRLKRNAIRRLFTFSVAMWFVVVSMQLILRKPVVGFLIPQYRYNPIRGSFVIGFAPEPSFLAKEALFMLLLNDVFLHIKIYGKYSHLFIRFLGLFMMLFSFSLTGAILATMYMTLEILLFSKRKIISLIAFLIVVLLIFQILSMFIPRLRILKIILSDFDEFIRLVLSDPSFRGRVFGSISAIEENQFTGRLEYTKPSVGFLGLIKDSGILGWVILINIYILIFLGILSKDAFSRRFSLMYAILFPFYHIAESVAVPYFAFILGIISFLRAREENENHSRVNLLA